MRIKEVLLIIAFIFTFVLVNRVPLSAESGIYDRFGIIPEHGLHGAADFENIDLFTGNLTLKFLDIHLPGINGLDLEIWRVYNSKIVKDNIPPQIIEYNQELSSWVGFGWSLHMGRIHYYTSDEPIVEFPDGRWETAYPDIHGLIYTTRSFLKYDRQAAKLYFKDGTTWTMGATSVLYLGTQAVPVRLVTEIKNSFGNTINVTYRYGKPIIEKITDSLGREVFFDLDDTSQNHPKLDRIRIKNTDGQWITFDYTVQEFPTPINCYKLTSFNPPEIPATTYDYYYYPNNQEYELKSVDTGFGGRMEYEYEDHDFKFYSYTLRTRVVKTKRIKFTSTDSYKTWNYTYPDYQNSTGTVTVDGPLFDTKATFYGYPDSDPYENGWRIGLLKEKWFTDNSYSEEQEWTYQQISNNEWQVLNQNLGKIRAPLLSKSIKTREGDAESTEEYLYERSDVKNYGLPTKIKYFGGTTGTTLKNYKTLEYFFEDYSSYENNYLLSYISNESIFNSSGTKLKETKTKYYLTPASKYGALDEIKRWKSGTTYLTWDYTYAVVSPRDITITINLPGTGGTETYEYSYGVLSELRRPGYTELTRDISQYNSAIEWEINQHGGRMDFTYDDLNRVERIDMPTGFNAVVAIWSTNSVAISQGGNSVVKYWDGMGRDTGFKESGDGINLHFLKTLDAEGRVTAESKGSTSPLHTYSYQWNAAGNPRKITDPRGKITNIFYSGDQKTVTDAEGKATVFYYEGIPGLATQLKDPTNKYALYTYDGSGRLTQVKYNNARTQTYAYNGLDQVISEAHPETGTITYSYNTSNNLQWRKWDNKYINYQYNSSNQLTNINVGTGLEDIDYIYDTSGRVKKISSNYGWYRDNITYNEFGSIREERQHIDAPVPMTLTLNYDYDGNNNLNSITYPDNNDVNISSNSLNMPETISFEGKSLISQVAYGINKQPVSMTISGNNTSFNASYENNGLLSYTSLKKGGITHYQANYGYDNVGNITSISNTVPSLNATFGYDSLYRLTSAFYSGGKNYTYTYDYYGNLKTTKENGTAIFNTSFNTKNQISSSGFDYDNRGNLTEAPGFEYEWDRQNRLSTVKLDTGETTSTHIYNERGLRLKSSRAPAPSISVTSPAGGETWYRNWAHYITWTTTGLIDDYVKILLYQGDTQVLEITGSTGNNGTYEWLIPLTLSIGEYRVAVQTIDGNVTGSSANFFIAEGASINITSPNGGENWPVGSSQNITWSYIEPVGDVKIEYSIDNGTSWIEIISSTSNNGSFSWTIPDTQSSNCLVRVGETDGDPMDVSDAVFSIIPPIEIIVTSPNGGERWEVATYHDITWLAPVSVANVAIYFSKDNGSTWDWITTSTPNDGIYSWRVDGTDYIEEDCLVRIDEQNGLLTDISDAVFTIAKAAITLTSPAGGEQWEVGSSHNITWTSSETFDFVNIEFSPTGISDWTTIIDSTPNDGSHNWTVPNSISDSCRIRIKDIDGSPSDWNTELFSIVPVPVITVTSPNGGEVWGIDTSQDITWTSVGAVGDVKIELSTNNGTSWTTIVASTANDGSYNWTVQGNPSVNCLLRVSETDGTPSDVCDAVFTVVLPTITITSPNGGETWEINTSHPITWTSAGTTGNVKIDYSTNNGTTWTPVTASTANDGSYNWTVPHAPSENCLIRVSEIDGTPSDVNDTVFSIVLPPIIITSPKGGETWEKNSSHPITWNYTDTVDYMKIDYSTDNGTTWTTIIASTANDESYDWTVPDTPSEGCLVRVSETDGDPYGISDKVFSIVDELEPGITVISPNGGEIWEIDSNRDITWSSTGTVGEVKIEYSIDNGSSWTTIVTSTGNDGTYNWIVPANPSENCLIRISEIDSSPIDTGDAVFSIVFDTSPCGKLWSMSNYSGTDIFQSAAYGNSLFAAVGDGGVIFTGSDGITWNAQSPGITNALNGVVYGYNTFVAVGDSGVILTSLDGTNWTPRTSGISNNLRAITYESNKFVAVGNSGVILTSPYGINWTPQSSGTSDNLRAIAYGGDKFVIAGNSGLILTSPYGTNWTPRSSGTSDNLRGITHGNGTFVAVGNSGVILTSPDGIDWVTRTSILSIDLLGAAYGSGKYVIVGQNGEILTSPDGIGWTAQSSGVSHHLYGVVYDNARFVAAGEEVILYSLCGTGSPTITITSPNGGESVMVGTNLTITWAGTGTIGNVKIEYSTDSGTSWTEITASYPNNGSYDWTVPDTPSIHCLVRVSETDGDPSDLSDSEFFILPASDAAVTVTSPNGGEILAADSTHEITWTTIGTIDNVFIEYSFDNGTTWKTIALSTLNNGSYDWTVPDTPSDECLVRIGNSDAADGEPSDVSDALFSIVSAHSITVTSPNGGEIWEMGSTYNITWTSTGTVGNVKIEYSIDRGVSWTGIIAPYANSGSYEWTVPNIPGTPLDNCLVRISEHDVDGGLSDVSDEAFFIISSSSSYIRVTAPNGGENLTIGSTYTITWASTATVGDVKIAYSTDNGFTWTEIAAATENDGQYDWIVPGTLSDTCLVQVSETDGDPTDVSDAVFSIVIPSTITVTSPNGGETWEVGSAHDITWTHTGTIVRVRLEYSIDSGASWVDIATSTGNDGIYNWTIPDKPSDNCLVRISGIDGDENPFDASDAEFSIASSLSDTITITSPNGGEGLVAGYTYNIAWVSTGSVNDVTIEYSNNSGTSWTEITASTGNDGTFEWTVPDDPSNNCLVRVGEAGDGDPLDVSDAVFSIVSISSTITVTSPNGNETLTAGSTHEITWTSTGTIIDVIIEYSTDSGTSWTTIVTSTVNNGSFNWTIPGTPSDNCLVRISENDEDRYPSDVSDMEFSIVSSSSETVTVTSPNGGESLVIGSLHEITWTSTGTIGNLRIEYSTDNGGKWINIVSSTENDGIFTWDVPDKESDRCLVRISDSDSDTGAADVSDDVFSIVTDEPPSCGGSWSNSNYTGNDTFNAVTYGGGKFVAVGNNGVIKTSSDGINWTSRTSNTTDNLYGVDHGVVEYTGVTTYIICGENGTIMTSPDAINWTAKNSGTNNTLYSVIHDYYRFAAVGVNGTIVAGPDGVTWYDYSLNISQTLYSTAFSYTIGSIFVAVGADGVVLTSPDGAHYYQPSSVTSKNLRGVTFGGNQFVAVGDNGVILTSFYSFNWTGRTSSINVDLLDAAYGNGLYVVVGNSGKILTSSDCVYWNSQASGVRCNLSGVAFGNSRFVAVGEGEIIYSMCDQAGAANSLNNQTFLRGPGGTRRVFPKRAPGRRRQEIKKNIDVKASLNLVSPNGDETLQAGENFLITWENEKHIKNIKLEYSPDNGSTYLLIKDRIPNTGYFEWHVPHHISSNCLVRISNANGVNPEQNILLYDFKFRINSLTSSPTQGKDFTLWLGDKDNMNPSIPEISIIQEPNGKGYICFEENIKEIGHSKEFHNRWHRLKILSDYNNDKISIFLDEKPVFKNIPLSPGYLFNSAVSMSTAACDTTDVEIDDFQIQIFSSIDNENRFITIFKEDFERFDEGSPPENSGWISKEIRSREKNISSEIIKSISVQSDSINGNKSLKVNNSERNQFIVVKHFNVHGSFPFDISDRLFEIKYNKGMEELSSQELEISRHESKSSDNHLDDSNSTYDSENSHGPNTGSYLGGVSSASGSGRIQLTSMIDTYYIYSFDGKLMAEYDHDGNCVKDYIYAGNRLIAEYQPQTGKYYYYMSDQINSTRIVTDDSGNVVYSAAHRPFGKFKDVWTKTYDPKLKFSGKEREDYSDLDYFGARYYDHNSYRFISVDPIINKREALINPQLWNLYSYCRNNPITFMDPDGKLELNLKINQHPVEDVTDIPNNPELKHGKTTINKKNSGVSGESKEFNGKWYARFKLSLELDIWYFSKSWKGAKAHEWRHANDILFVYFDLISVLESKEMKSFSSKGKCERFISMVEKMAATQIALAHAHSSLWRDLIPILEIVPRIKDKTIFTN